MKQQTISQAISYEGAGLHSGLPVQMRILPSEPNTGITFVRTDLPGTPSVKADIRNVTNTMRATTLEDGEAKVFTVEHILAAFYGMDIDNCIIELNSPEPPIADGGSATFVQLIKEAGIVEQDAERRVYVVKQSHGIYEDDKFIIICPYDGFRVTFTSINSHPMLGTQHADYEINPDVFATEIAPARTIGFTKEIEQLQAMGLAKGGSTENVIVYDDTTCLSELNFPDELVRHKILDILGDLFLVGHLKGHIIAVKSSHNLNSRLSREILKEMQEEA
jgi:UDP-3-O-[3-hydroxymyristoyl] N-acetylglucosamine deacetylase